MIRTLYTRLATLLLLIALLPVFGVAQGSTAQDSAAHAYTLSGEFHGVHDPSIIRDGDTYYLFATGKALAPHEELPPPAPPAADGTPAPAPAHIYAQLPIRCSKDLKQWTRCGAVFPEGEPAWIRQMSPKTEDLWAPDISFYDGQFHLYYAFSVFGKNTSGIALLTNKTLDPTSPSYKWVDQGLVLQSKESDDYNAIDPNLILDDEGQAWLSFGSFWSGIKMVHLDRSTGKPSTTDTRLYALATRAKPPGAPDAKPGLPPDWEAVEAPFILRHGAFYYLFVSWDLCCRGTKSTYRTMVGRSSTVHGPYVDQSGKPMSEGGGTPLLSRNDSWNGAGGESLLHEKNGPNAGKDLIVFHAYDAINGRPALRISTLGWKDNWPSAELGERQP